jgi:threonine dehydrogenase-like Zn-dependent dehydrogenase
MIAYRFDFSIPRILATRALRPVWRGVVWSPLSPTRRLRIPDQPLPGPRWIRVRNLQTGICATDLSLLLVRGGPRISIAALPGFSQFYLGHEVLSVVTEAGPDVQTIVVGDRVVLDTTITGPTCASQSIVPACRHCTAGNVALCENQSAQAGPVRIGGGWGDGYVAHESEVHGVPEALTSDQAVLLEPAGVALRTVAREPPRPGDHVLIVGCGILGLLVCGLAKIGQPAAHVTAMARYPHQAAMARKMGADEVLGPGDVYAEVARLTGARLYRGQLGNQTTIGGFDVVYNMVGSARALEDSLRWTRAGGTVVVAGIAFDSVRVDLTPVWHQEVSLKGITGHEIDAWHGRPAKALGLLAQWMAEGTLRTDGLITHRYPLRRIREAVATALARDAGAIKVVLDVGDGIVGRGGQARTLPGPADSE